MITAAPPERERATPMPLHRPILLPRRLNAALVAASTLFEVEPAALLGRGRTRVTAHARQFAWAALYTACDTSHEELGRAFDRHHTTVMYGVDRVTREARRDPDARAAMELISDAARGA